VIHDPRVDPLLGGRVSWGLLARLGRDEAYVIDPHVMDGVGPWSASGTGATGVQHLGLIERSIRDAPDPRAGELAVRLSYALAAAQGTVSSSAPAIATQIAALVRDRELAKLDLRDLLGAAARDHHDVMTELVAARDARTFRVEQPALAPLPSALRVAAMNAVPALVQAIDTLTRDSNAAGAAAASILPTAVAPILGPRFASRLATLGASQPPLAQVAVTLRGRGRAGAGLRASNEETLTAAYVLATDGADSLRRDAALAVLAGAVALRSYAQESPWFVGDPAPDPDDLITEFGLASVTFARSVPAGWRGYYLRELQHGLQDMADVLPAFSVAGLNVSIGTADLPDSALAMHNPRSRTVQLNIATSSGTLAHELAHDLDWQTSRRLFAAAGGYSTDRAVRAQHGVLANSVRGLAAARTQRPFGSPASAAMPDRPAELFARGADWFTATALALRGRSDPFLSAVQDAAIPGYAAGSPTAVGVAGSSSLLSAIDQMTSISDTLRAGFESVWSDASTIDPLLLVRRVLSAPIGRAGWRRPESVAAQLPSSSVSVCAFASNDEDRARARLLSLAIEARARGIAARRMRYTGMSGPRAPLDENAVRTIENAIIIELRSAAGDQGVLPLVPASFRSSDESCSAITR
jgi:hypothetical protein